MGVIKGESSRPTRTGTVNVSTMSSWGKEPADMMGEKINMNIVYTRRQGRRESKQRRYKQVINSFTVLAQNKYMEVN